MRLPKALSTVIDDSKKLPPTCARQSPPSLHQLAMVGIGLAYVEEIDTINILRASLLAMHRAVEALPVRPLLALVDGNQKPPLAIPIQTIIGGDGVELAIAAASIVAKVHRDRLMQALHDGAPALRLGQQCSAIRRATIARHCAGMAARRITAPASPRFVMYWGAPCCSGKKMPPKAAPSRTDLPLDQVLEGDCIASHERAAGKIGRSHFRRSAL